MTTVDDRIDFRISPDILDRLGGAFNFNHGKGIAEWLKNSLDNYLRLVERGLEERDGRWPVLLSLIDTPGSDAGPNLALLDFGGTTFDKVDQFFLHWGDTTASRDGGQIRSAAVTGGHGNGGKFYMRQMWRHGTRFLTWREGRVTSLVVDAASVARRRNDGTLGNWEFRDDPLVWRDALERALLLTEGLGGSQPIVEHLEQHHPELLADLDDGTRGFTIVVGRGAIKRLSSNDVVRSRGRWDAAKLLEAIQQTPQARRPLSELDIAVLVNGVTQHNRLAPVPVELDPEWPPVVIPLTADCIPDTGAPGQTIGQLTISKSVDLLQGRLRDSNSLLVLDGDGNPVARYDMGQLPVPGRSSLGGFLRAELRLDFAGFKELITNDREHLEPSSEQTRAILDWVGQEIRARCAAIQEALDEQQRRSDLDLAAELNEELNKHARRFLETMRSEVLVDIEDDDEGGGAGQSGSGEGGRSQGRGGDGRRRDGRGGNSGVGGSKETPGSSEKRQRPEYPRILLSGRDPDPSRSDGESRLLSERHPPLYQDPDLDQPFNVWWLNTEHFFAREALDRGGPKGAAFRSHQLSMFRDLVLVEALRMLHRQRHELDLQEVEVELMTRTNKFLAELPRQLVSELLD